MREKLKERLGERSRYKGTFEKYKLRPAYKGLAKITFVLINVQTINGEEITDHLWFTQGKTWAKLGPLYPGDVIAFDARSKPYTKGKRDFEGEYYRERDYKLSNPTKMEFLSRGPEVEYSSCDCGYHNPVNTIKCSRCRRPLGEKPDCYCDSAAGEYSHCRLGQCDWLHDCKRCGDINEEKAEPPPKMIQNTLI